MTGNPEDFGCKQCRHMVGTALLGIAAIATSLILASPSARADHGDEHHWINPDGGSFQLGDNWDEGVPGATDVAVFDLDAIYEVMFGSSVTNDRLRVRDGEVKFFLHRLGVDFTYTLTGSSDSVVVGESVGEESSLTLQRGTLAGVDAILGEQAGSDGALRLEDSATLDLSGQLQVGVDGTGSLTIESGGSVSNTIGRVGFASGSNGTVTVSGTDGDGNPSTWTNTQFIDVGLLGTGTLTIADGGSVSNTDGYLGFAAGSEGTVTVSGMDGDGNASTWTNTGELRVGWNGTGTLTIADGGSVSNTFGWIGLNAGSSGAATVTGNASTWTNTGEFRIGNEGTGELTIADGGTVSNSDGFIGRTASGEGAVTVSGTGSKWTNSESLYVGGSEAGTGGTGTLTVGPGATVYVEETLKLWDDGTVNLHGGTIRFDGYDREPTGAFNYLAGTVQLAGDRAVGLDPVIDELYGPSPVLPAHKGLAIEGTATIVVPVTLAGGTFSVGDIVNAGLIDFQHGTLRLTDASLSVAAAGQFGDALMLAAGQTLHAEAGATIDLDGRLTVKQGAVFSSATTVTNRGRITGGGRIDAAITNLRETPISGISQIQGEIRVAGGDRLLVNGTITNRSRIDVMPGGELETTGRVTSGSLGSFATPDVPGEIYVRDATLRLPNTTISTGLLADAGLINRVGTLGFSFGTSDVFGTILNENKGQIILSGDSQATFYNHVRNDGEVRVSGDSQAVWFGDVTGSGTFTGSGTNFFEGSLSPGNSAALLTFEGDARFGSASSLVIELGGTTKGSEYDALEVAGHVVLDGVLHVSLIDSFAPAAGDTFEILAAAHGIAGTFADELLPALSDELFWNVLYGSNSLVLEVAAPALPGDFNNDGIVDAADYTVWRDGLGGPFDAADYDLWKQNFGATAADAGSVADSPISATVPEPSGIFLVLLGLALLPLCRPTVPREGAEL